MMGAVEGVGKLDAYACKLGPEPRVLSREHLGGALSVHHIRLVRNEKQEKARFAQERESGQNSVVQFKFLGGARAFPRAHIGVPNVLVQHAVPIQKNGAPFLPC